MIEVEVADEIAPLAAEWDALAERLRAGPFLTPDWIEAHWSAFDGGRLAIIVARRDGALGAVLPLVRRRGTARSVTNAQTPHFGMLSEDAELTTHALNALERLGVSRLALSYVDRDDPLAVAVRERARADRRLLAERVMLRSPYIAIDGTLANYQERLTSSFRSSLRRRTRRLAKLGDVELDLQDGSRELDELLAEGWRLEGAGWKGRAGTAVAARPATERFYEEVARRFAVRDGLQLSFLRLDGRAIAFMMGLKQEGVLYLLKGGFDPEYERLSPGQLLQERVIANSFATGLARIELLGDAEPYKLHWTDSVHERVSLQSFRRSALRCAQWAALAHGRPLALRMGLDRVARPVRDRARSALNTARTHAGTFTRAPQG